MDVEGAIKIACERPTVDEAVTVVTVTGRRYFMTECFDSDHEIDVPYRDTPLDERSREVNERHQTDVDITD